MDRLPALLLGSRVRGRAAWLVALVRVAAGVVFVSFSLGKFIHHSDEAESFARFGIPAADAMVYLVGVLELGGGLLLVAGLLTRLAALGLAVNMAVAISTAGRIDGGVVNLGLAPALLAAMLLLLWAGPGRLALDARLLPRAQRRAPAPVPAP